MSDARPLPRWVTTPLLTVITEQSLDLDYEHVARRKAHERERAAQEADPSASVPDAPRHLALGATVVVVIFGVLLAMAAVQASRTAAVRNASNEELISRIDARRAALTQVQRETAQVQQSTTTMQAAGKALGQQLQQESNRQFRLEGLAGFAPASGPGVRVVVADAPGGDQSGEVRDEDLAKLVNGLWHAGATAISVDGQRLTAVSALRNSGTAIRLNDVSLSSPYTVLALGNASVMVPAFQASTTGREFESIVQRFGMPFSLQNESKLALPAAPASLLSLSHARLADHPKESS